MDIHPNCYLLAVGFAESFKMFILLNDEIKLL